MKKIFVCIIFVCVMVVLFVVPPVLLYSQEKPGTQDDVDELFELSLEELMKVKIVYKRKAMSKTWALVILKMISLDRNIHRLGDPIQIGVASDKVLAALNRLEDCLKVRGRRFRAYGIRTLKDALRYPVVFIARGSGVDRPSVMEELSLSRCLIFTDDERHILFGYAAVLLTIKDKRTCVAVNLDNASQQGTQFYEDHLDMVTTIREGM
jgi:hypothetical protein